MRTTRKDVEARVHTLAAVMGVSLRLDRNATGSKVEALDGRWALTPRAPIGVILDCVNTAIEAVERTNQYRKGGI